MIFQRRESVCKSLLFKVGCSIDRIGIASLEIKTRYPRPTWAEQDPNDWWRLVTETIRMVLKKTDTSPEKICAVGLCAQSHAPVLIDEKGKPLMKSLIWSDLRAQAQSNKMTTVLQKEGVRSRRILPFHTAAKLLWIKEKCSNVYKKTSKILLPFDFIRFKLTGIIATTEPGATGMFDRVQKKWIDPILNFLELTEDKLPEIHSPNEIAGGVTREAAKETGLEEGTPVIYGGGDALFIPIGVGAINEGDAVSYLGTAPSLLVCVKRRVANPKGHCINLPSIENRWWFGGFAGPVGLAFSWFKDQFGELETEVANRSKLDVYDLLTRQAEQVKPGSEGLIFLPHIMGMRSPTFNANSKAIMYGLSGGHTRAHIIRAIMEGIVYELKWIAETIEKENNVKFFSIRAVGGGAKSSCWRQILADCLNRTVLLPKEREAGALGVALTTVVSIGKYKSIEEACGTRIPIVSKVVPNKEANKTYEKMFKLFKKIYVRTNL